MMKKEVIINYDLLRREELSEDILRLEEAAVEVAHRAYAPYSCFSVGAAVLLANGEIVVGSNQENAAYPSGMCAERTALYYAGAMYPDVAPLKLIIVAFNEKGRVPIIPPCGSCRQVIMESATRFAPFEILLAGDEEVVVLKDCRKLLPFAFSQENL